MGNGESTTRMLTMTKEGGAIKVTEGLAKRLYEEGYNQEDEEEAPIHIRIDNQEEWEALRKELDSSREARMLQKKGWVQMNHLEELIQENQELVQEREFYQEDIEKMRGTLNRFKTEYSSLVAEQSSLRERMQDIGNTEEQWKKILEETTQQEADRVRAQMAEEQEATIRQLKEQWQTEQLSAVLPDAGEAVAAVEAKYQSMLAEQLESEKEKLRLQLEQEQNEKLQSLEAEWKAAVVEKESLLQQLEANKTTAESVGTTDAVGTAEADTRLAEALEEKEALRLQLEEVEGVWRRTLEEQSVEAQRAREALEDGVEERLKHSAEVVAQELGEALQGKLDEMKDGDLNAAEKEALREQLVQEQANKLHEVETTFTASLNEVEEKALKEKEDILLKLAGEEEAFKIKLEEFEKEKEALLTQLEDDKKANVAEVEAKWQDIIREGTGKAVHIGTADDLKSVIGEIESTLTMEKEALQRDHEEAVRSLNEDYLNAKNEAEAKISQQEKEVNEMLQKVELLQSREEDVRQQFDTSAAKVESLLRPLREERTCVEPRDVAVSCHKENSSQPLRCTEAVMKFMACVDAQRLR